MSERDGAALRQGEERSRRCPAARRCLAVAGVALAGLAVLAACEAGSGEGLDAGGRPLGEGGEIPLAATLQSIQVHVFDAECTVCHAGAAAPLGLRLDAANSYTQLVGVPSRQDGSLLRVAPGNPDASYLVRKLEGTASVGGRMPLGGAPLPAETIAFVRQWIADGAFPASDPGGDPGGDLGSAGSPAVVSLDPPPGSTLAGLPPRLVVGFDRALDASTVNALTVVLEHSSEHSSDRTFAGINAVGPASVRLAPRNARVVLVELAGLSAAAGEWRLVVHGSGPNVVLSVDGAALAGDGAPGSDYVATFTVEKPPEKKPSGTVR